jgi:predicted nucleotidyltransferase
MSLLLSEAEVSMLCSVFAHFPEISSVRVFGSRAKGNAKAYSDVDVVSNPALLEHIDRLGVEIYSSR